MFLIQLEELFNRVYPIENIVTLSLNHLKKNVAQGDIPTDCPEIDLEHLSLDFIRTNIFINNTSEQKPFFRVSFGVVLPNHEDYIFRYDVDFNTFSEILDDYVYKTDSV
jgi:hypothetical protein